MKVCVRARGFRNVYVRSKLILIQKKCAGLCMCAQLFSCLARCQWLAYSAPNSCKVPPSPLLTNSCRSCPLRCAQTPHCFCLRAYACTFEEETGKRKRGNSRVARVRDANSKHSQALEAYQTETFYKYSARLSDSSAYKPEPPS